MRKMLINAPARGDLDSIDNYLRFEKCNPQAVEQLQDYANILLQS